MQWLANISVRRSVFATVLTLAILVMGGVSYLDLGVDSFPNIDAPTISVKTALSGGSPEIMEAQVSEKIEEAVSTISGIDELSSTSSEGLSEVTISFVLEKNADVAAQEVRDKIDSILSELPEDAETPVVSKLDPDASPILYIAVVSPPGARVREASEVADKQVKRQLEGIAGVGQATVIGGRARQINVWLKSSALRAHGVTASEVQTALAAQNVEAPGGSIDTGPKAISVRVQGKLESVKALEELVVRSVDGHAILLKDVARVEDGEEQEKTAAQLDGKDAVLLAIRKQSGANTVAVVESVRSRLAELRRLLPSGYGLEVVRDSSRVIQTQVDAVREHLVLGALFASIVVLLFLGNARSTLIAAVAIPVSVIGTFTLMWFAGFTLNVITLLALALAVGIVIDDAIVVLENIFRFIHDKKLKPFPAAILATKEIGPAVLATTLSLMAVFLPVAFMSGIVGRVLTSFGLTMAFAIGVSLIVSFTLTPMLAARWLDPASDRAQKTALERLVDRVYRPLERAYLALLRPALRRRGLVVVLCLSTLASCIPLARSLPVSFLPRSDEANFQIDVRAPEGTSLHSTRLIAERIAREARRMPGVLHTLMTIGDGSDETSNVAAIYVKLTDPADRAQSQEELIERTRKEIISKQPKELRVDVSDVSSVGGGAAKAVNFTISGPELEKLADYSRQIVDEVRKAPAAVDVDSSLVVGKPEAKAIVLRERAAALGVQVSDISNALRLMVSGATVSTLREAGEDYDIVLRAEPTDRNAVEQVGVFSVHSSTEGSVPLKSVVNMQTGTTASQIERHNRQRQVTISANVASGRGESEVQAAIEAAFERLHVPASYSGSASGRSRETERTSRSFLLAFAISCLCMYLVLAAQFDSWLHPFTVMLSLPLTIPFALLSLWLFGQSLNLQSALGMLVLLGVVKKNAILQVDQTNTLRAHGMARDQAILEANRERLRPILMTTISFVAGMLPLIFSRGIGAGTNHATAGVVVGGQLFSLLLTLVAIPVFYSLFDDLMNWLQRTFGSRRLDRGERELDVRTPGGAPAE